MGRTRPLLLAGDQSSGFTHVAYFSLSILHKLEERAKWASRRALAHATKGPEYRNKLVYRCHGSVT